MNYSMFWGMEDCLNPKKKVYCKDCEYYYTLYGDSCGAPENIKKVDTCLEVKTIYKKKCSELNKNNDCLYYKKYKRLTLKKRAWYKFWDK